MSIIDIDDVTFSYSTGSSRAAISGIDCSIERGSFVGITGPSDAGKTTFARLLPGYIPHFYDGEFSGTVTIGGTDTRTTSMADLAATVGLVFENPFDQLTGASMTVLEEVAFGLEQRGLPRNEIFAKVEESLQRVGISDLLDRNPQELSGGQSQRLAIASIFAMEPDVLVLDEPTSQLDPHGTNDVFEVLANLNREQYTTVIVSQDLDRLVGHLDRLIVMEEGEIVLDGEPAAVLDSDDEILDRINVPESVEIGKRLRSGGFVNPATPLPIRTEDAVEELTRHVASDAADTSAADAGPASARSGDDAPWIEFEDVHHYYDDDVHALRGISIEIDAGCVCIIGQNGAGKTTFVKHLNGLLMPTEGTVYIDGQDTAGSRVAQLSRLVGLSFQNPNDQIFHNSVEEEIAYGPRNLGDDPDETERLVEQQLDLLELNDVRNRDPYDIGLARRKHVAMASVLAMDTPVVVLDEPTGGQDRPGTRLIGDVVEQLVDDGKLVVVITHDITFAARHADRVVALRQGEILLDGDPRTVFDQPDRLAETMVEPPKVTQIADTLGIPRTVLTIDELFEFVTDPPAEN